MCIKAVCCNRYRPKILVRKHKGNTGVKQDLSQSSNQVHVQSWYIYMMRTSSLWFVDLAAQFLVEGLNKVLLCPRPCVLWLWHFPYILVVFIPFPDFIYTTPISREHSWRVWIPKHDTIICLGDLLSLLVPMDPTVWPNDHREDYKSCAWPLYSFVQTFPKALHSD